MKYIIPQNRTGKLVNDFSALPENEVLFHPFTKFHIIDLKGEVGDSIQVTMEEIIES